MGPRRQNRNRLRGDLIQPSRAFAAPITRRPNVKTNQLTIGQSPLDVVSGALRCIARMAKHLEIAGNMLTSVGDGHDVIELKFRPLATPFASTGGPINDRLKFFRRDVASVAGDTRSSTQISRPDDLWPVLAPTSTMLRRLIWIFCNPSPKVGLHLFDIVETPTLIRRFGGLDIRRPRSTIVRILSLAVRLVPASRPERLGPTPLGIGALVFPVLGSPDPLALATVLRPDITI